ncbi:MAG: MerR family DNA-binding protein [Colwellia sp.]|jgi:MerR family Zn(II)-responsive transcriptional regulator of zntA|uniref:MerR family DNA-binding protein n=2 Tax=unclassified Pseudoalteromonas TaxID=194690 RepID=UPI000518D5B2|nr:MULTISPECIES: MerR family DNA-binding protein [unclassified Pseudoalteromonas]MBL1386358.1 MerR family DNA-binding protein [Colwellia sp.]TMS92667.1 MerR family DNA-binding transcriptional regulator [Pseudoalteromonas sp. S201]|tara:strand:+ start:3798 stop:4205 length:408 start_codon:yes stop_codon:yes gene_type:complete
MKVSQLAKVLNTTPDTVRYYSRIGLIMPIKNTENGYKSYNQQAQQRLKFILSARQLDFSVEEIKEILLVADNGSTACPLVREIVEHRLAETEKKFNDALILRNVLRSAIDDWKSKPDKSPTGDMLCHLIQGCNDE